MGIASFAGLQGRERACAPGPGPTPRRSVAEPGGPPLCPPARNDYRRWAELVAGGLDPTLMPAIESGVSVVAYALATPEMSAGDLLRIGGNGVDPLVVAYAFCTLCSDWRMDG